MHKVSDRLWFAQVHFFVTAALPLLQVISWMSWSSLCSVYKSNDVEYLSFQVLAITSDFILTGCFLLLYVPLIIVFWGVIAIVALAYPVVTRLWFISTTMSFTWISHPGAWCLLQSTTWLDNKETSISQA